LGKIGDASVGAFLLNTFNCERASGYGAAFAMLKYRPAVPRLVNCLAGQMNEYIALELLGNLRDIGDTSALPSMEQSVKLLEQSSGQPNKAGARILMQMREPDPCAVLLTMLDREDDIREQVGIIRDLGRYHDQRTVDRLFAAAVSSEHTLVRGNAIRTLATMNDKQSLLALTRLLKTNAPPPTDFDKMAILSGRPSDYSKRESVKALHEATRYDFGDDAEAWSRWVIQNR
jgi:HEAT repeat protein